MNKMLRIAVCAGHILLTPVAIAAIPQTINYQGYLTSNLGVPVNIGTPMTFRLYDVAVGGTALWSENWGPVSVNSGNFNVALGSITPLNLNFDVPYWLGVEIGSNGEMPRLPLSSVPYAAVAAGLDSTAEVPGSQITGTISMAIIGGSQITGSISGASIGGSQITDAITSATIGGSQITGNIVAANDIVGGGSIFLSNSTASVGNIVKGGTRFIHNFGSQSTFVGEAAGNFTQTGGDNTANGAFSMQGISTGFNNTATGASALRATTSGFQNSAFGVAALLSNVGGNNNSAMGSDALRVNTSGGGNTAGGRAALISNTGGSNNTAFGFNALYASTGSSNIAIGADAGGAITSGTKNIHIGNVGTAGDSNTIRLGITGDQTATYIAAIAGNVITGLGVMIDASGRLGVTTSSRTFKDAVTDMGGASDILMRLRPVTFHYKAGNAADPRLRQFGLIAEEVAEVAPDLVAYSAEGKIESVYYQHLSPMLLNEFQKQQRTIRAQTAELTRQGERVEILERELQAIRAMLGSR